ncbi:bleomycin resistance family protein [Variovorax sp. J22P168]|uniref:VOC family protein n=1 Tax=Variovorax jilinensis TaxID=3053513 RepID=UPI002574FA7A|nr:VOC family protein [Variovorax sp. J22P168]MDM0013936.1 bleomycin resistance family protein [Variovorax sp. J22P168]
MALTPLLRCADIGQTRDFYARVLGFAVADSAQGTLTVELHGSRIVFTAGDLWKSDPTLSGTLYITVPDVDGYHAAVTALVPLAWPLQDMPYGSREFGVADCNGYLLAFQQQA